MINAVIALAVVAITLEAVAMSNYARGSRCNYARGSRCNYACSRHAYFAPLLRKVDLDIIITI